MVSMQTPLATVQATWQAQYPGRPFPGKASAVAALGSAPVTHAAAPAAAAPASIDTAAAITRLHDRIEAFKFDLKTNATWAHDQLEIVSRSLTEALTRTDDRLTGEVQGLAGQVNTVIASVQSLDAAMRRAA